MIVLTLIQCLGMAIAVHIFQLYQIIIIQMSSFKSAQLIIDGKIVKVTDTIADQECSFYIKARFFEGEDWKLLTGANKFQTFESEAVDGVSPIEQPFTLEYISQGVRGWPKMLVQVWRVDQYGRHNIYGYGSLSIPMASGWHSLEIACWRPMGSWFDRFIGANSELQYPDIAASSLSKYGLRTMSGCIVTVEINIIGRNFHLHGVLR